MHADVLLHVVDASSPVRHEQIEQVNRVLAEINALDIPQIVVMNKIDAAPELLEQGPRLERDEDGIPTRVFLSAREGIGLDALREAVVEVAQWLASRPPSRNPMIRAWATCRITTMPMMVAWLTAATLPMRGNRAGFNQSVRGQCAASSPPVLRSFCPIPVRLLPGLRELAKVARMTARIPLLQLPRTRALHAPVSPEC
ncbi:hypothetical protein AU476_40355 [Cupriavidus sp. UYMSc13B]|nr:hypothetical protein AU476_40355 [Cupriavidus sp. UYMSc13B]